MAKAVATLGDFEALANELDLVAMTHLVPTITENVGDVRGYAPYTAMRMYNDGLAEPVEKVAPSGGKPKAGPTENDEDKRKSGVEIPEGWAELHHLQRISLGKNIAGKGDTITSAAQADTVIKAELDRRAGGVSNDVGPNAVTSQKTVTN